MSPRIVFLIVLIIVVGGFFVWQFLATETDKQETSEARALNICNQIKDIGTKKSCIAQVLGDEAACLDIASEKDEQELEPIVDTEAACLSALAYQKKNPAICDEIKTGRKSICHAWVAGETKDESLCENLAGDRKDLCFRKVAFSKNTIGICDKVVNEDDKLTCKALIQRDLSLCSQIENKVERESCVTGIAQVVNDIGLCNEIDSDIGKLGCVGYFAVQNNDNTICTQYENLYKVSFVGNNYCLAVTTLDPKLCNKVDDVCRATQPDLICSDLKNECLLDIATEIIEKGLPSGRVY